MQTPKRFAFARTCFKWAAAASAVIGLSACANGHTAPEAPQSATPVTHNCKPQETVGFSCELRDQRLLSLCASPGFEKFKGAPKDNPGYVYLAVGSPQGEVQYSYPEDPKEYKKHFFIGVPTNGIPYMFVASSKGKFFYLGDQDDTDPEGAGRLTPENQPEGWDIAQKGTSSTCLRVLHFENFRDLRLPHESDWSKVRERIAKEKAKAKQP